MFKNKIGPFTRYLNQPNDIKYGAIYTLNVSLPIPYYPKRTVRVFLPENYDERKRYPVIYMSDGQNIVDKYTSAYGAWDIDVNQHQTIKEGYSSYIVVGIDCPKGVMERVYEYSFPHLDVLSIHKKPYMKKRKVEFYSHLYFEYIVKTLKPMVDKYFKTSQKREDTACAGSSMGGVFALALLSSYPDIFGAAFCFSPAFFLYQKKSLRAYLDDRLKDISKDTKLYFYSGNEEYEHRFINGTINMHHYFLTKGFDKDNLYLSLDVHGLHNEYTWFMHFNEAIRFWNKK